MRGSRVGTLLGVTVCAAALAAGGEARAQERFNPRVGLVTTGPFYRATVAARVNPIGLFGEVRAGFRLRLFNSPTRHILLRNTYVALGASVVASPAFVRPGVALEVQPLAILNLQVLYEPIVQWFGSFGNVQTYPDASHAGIGAGVLSSGNVPDNAQAARGWQLTLQGTLQARIGQTLAVRNTFRAVRSTYDADTLSSSHRADRVYYDPFYDVVSPLDGWVFTNDLDVLASLTDLGTNIGLRYTAVLPQLGDAAGPDVVAATHRLGPVITYTFKERRHAAFNAPTVFLLAQWWIRHPWRTGGDAPEAISQWMPMVVLGLSFRGDW